MEQQKRHQKAENFRQEIASVANRQQFINALLTKNAYDESDKLRITILFQKQAYLCGCEQSYQSLIKKIHLTGDESLIAKTATFSKKLNIKTTICQHY